MMSPASNNPADTPIAASGAAAAAASAAASAAGDASSASDSADDGPGNASEDSPGNATADAPGSATADAPGNAEDSPSNDNNNNNSPTTDPVSVSPTNPTDPNTVALSPIDAIQAEALTDPRGGSDPGNFPDTGRGVTTVPPGGRPPTVPVDVEIDAVIVSAAQSPWDAVERAPGVGTITVIGGIVALGKTPMPGEISGGGPQPPWLRVIPDLALLNGSKIPPVVPNVIDLRWLNCPIKVKEPANPVEDLNF
jgi:hypothetical protein